MTNSYDVVIATRNRQAVLQLSVPLMLSQTPLPANFIVVDSSDDHDGVKRALESVFKKTNTSVYLEVLRSEAGSSLQRNVGLEFVKSPVVFFPDDDAFWFEGFAKNILRVYALDVREEVGAVCGTGLLTPPPGSVSLANVYRHLEFRDLLAPYLRRVMSRIEDLFPDPLFFRRKHSQSDERRAGLVRTQSESEGF